MAGMPLGGLAPAFFAKAFELEARGASVFAFVEQVSELTEWEHQKVLRAGSPRTGRYVVLHIAYRPSRWKHPPGGVPHVWLAQVSFRQTWVTKEDTDLLHARLRPWIPFDTSPPTTRMTGDKGVAGGGLPG